MNINPQTLQAIRHQRGLSQQMLADMSHVTKKTISRIETGAGDPNRVRNNTIQRLASALGVKSGDLGKAPSDHSDRERFLADAGYQQVKSHISGDAALAYQQVNDRYGISRNALAEMAPLFFVLLAESSLVWRREALKEIDEATEALRKLDCETTGHHLSFVNAVYRIEEGSGGEENSIEERDIFGENLSGYAFDLGYNPTVSNPFAEFLRHLCKKIDDREVVELDLHGDEYLENMNGRVPSYRIFGPQFDQITGEDFWAQLAVKRGYTTISEIPGDLLDDDKKDERIEWLCSQIPESEKDRLEKLWDIELEEHFSLPAAPQGGGDDPS